MFSYLLFVPYQKRILNGSDCLYERSRRGWEDNMNSVSCLAYSPTLKMEVTCSSKTSVGFRRTTGHYIPEHRTLHIRRCENRKSYEENALLKCRSIAAFRQVKVKLSLYRPWWPVGLWEVEASTVNGHSTHRWRQGCQPDALAAFYPQDNSWYQVDPRAIVRLEGLGKLKKKIHLIRDSNLPACSIVPQPTTLPLAPFRQICRHIRMTPSFWTIVKGHRIEVGVRVVYILHCKWSWSTFLGI
jgi:hypothetical protein